MENTSNKGSQDLIILKSNEMKTIKLLSKYHLNFFLKKSIVIFYTEILTGKVVLWCFFSSETSEKIHNSTFQVKISV